MGSTDGAGTAAGERPVFGAAARVWTEFAVAPLRIATSAVTGWTDYFSAYLSAAGRYPLGPGTAPRVADDVLAWWQLRTTRQRPQWAHLAPATDETADCSIEDYLALLADTVELLGGRVNLVGDCQGGWLAVIYAALHPDQVNTLTIAGAPVDCHAGGSTIQDWTGLFGRAGVLRGPGPMAPYQAMVALGGGVQRGANRLLGFKLLEPAAEWQRELALLGHIRDPEYVARHLEFTNWLWALAERVGTPAEAVHRELVDAGHLGLFKGRGPLREHWAPPMARVRALSEV